MAFTRREGSGQLEGGLELQPSDSAREEAGLCPHRSGGRLKVEGRRRHTATCSDLGLSSVANIIPVLTCLEKERVWV